MKKILILLILLVFVSQMCYGMSAKSSQKIFSKLDKQEQLSMLKSMRKQELAQINSQIKDVKSRIKIVEENSQMAMNKKQNTLLELNRELTLLTDRKSELEKKYKTKINGIKNMN